MIAALRSARARSLSIPTVAIPIVAITLGCFALATRPAAWRATITLALVGAIGLVGRVPEAAFPSTLRSRRARSAATGAAALLPMVRMRWDRIGSWAIAVALGVAAFAAARAIDVPIPRSFTPAAIAANLFAAVAEEAFFRRYMYGRLAPRGHALAVALTAAAFAAVHVPLYGWAVVPLDAAAGLLLGWQRWATGSWSAPAITHAVANLLAMG